MINRNNLKYELNKYYNLDCVEAMKLIPDNYFELAIVDPPYFSGPEKRKFYGKKESNFGVKRVYQDMKTWELPTEEYFEELFRVSEHQIIWGVNYFTHIYDFGPGRIIWDKANRESDFSDAEIAYTSMHDSTRMFTYMWSGMFQGKSMTEGHIQQGNKALNEKRIHPTQKPVILYKWLLKEYATPGMKILDTHTGSASSLIACHDMGFPYLAFEKDPKMHQVSLERLITHTMQLSMFNSMGLPAGIL